MHRHAGIIALLIATLAGCEPTPCEDLCERLMDQCNETDGEVCYDGCDDAETACQRCYACLESIDACEIRPEEPCADDCAGCQGN